MATPVGDHRVRNAGFHPVEADHLPTFIRVSPVQTFPHPRPRDSHDLAPQSFMKAPESLFSASDDSFIGRRAWRPPDGLPASDPVAGKMPQDLHSAGLLVGP